MSPALLHSALERTLRDAPIFKQRPWAAQSVVKVFGPIGLREPRGASALWLTSCCFGRGGSSGGFGSVRGAQGETCGPTGMNIRRVPPGTAGASPAASCHPQSGSPTWWTPAHFGLWKKPRKPPDCPFHRGNTISPGHSCLAHPATAGGQRCPRQVARPSRLIEWSATLSRPATSCPRVGLRLPAIFSRCSPQDPLCPTSSAPPFRRED